LGSEKPRKRKIWRILKIFKELKTNNAITESPLRVIGENGEQLGVMPLAGALRASDEAGLDLVLVSGTSNPAVARIIDYGKYRYEIIRKEKEQKRIQASTKTKEVQLSLGIQENEIAFKMKAARRFIDDGDKVKVCINRIRGRQTQNADKGVAILNDFAAKMADIADIDQALTRGGVPGRNINLMLTLAPKKKK
jgi:translation initiation factor IF-3